MTWRWFSVTLPHIKNTDYISPNYAVKNNKSNKSIMRRVIKFIKQILQRIGQMSYNAPFCNMRAHFCYEMVHCGIWDWCIMGFICNRSILNTMKIQWKMWYIYSFSWYIEVRKNSRHFADNIFKMHFLEWKLIYFDSNFIEVYFMASNWKWVSTGSDNGLTLNRWQTIMWSNDDPFQWCIMHIVYASPDHDQLNEMTWVNRKLQKTDIHVLRNHLNFSFHSKYSNLVYAKAGFNKPGSALQQIQLSIC